MDKPNRTFSRSDTLKVFSTVPLVLVAPGIQPELDTWKAVEPQAEDIPGGVDLVLSPDEKVFWEKSWNEIKEVKSFANVQDYIATVSVLFNFTRAKDLQGDEFSTAINSFLDTPVSINGKGLTIVYEIQDQAVKLSRTRDLALKGSVSTSTYALECMSFFQSLVFSLQVGTETHDHSQYVTGGNWSKFSQHLPDKTVYQIDNEPLLTINNIATSNRNLFNLRALNPAKGFVQKEIHNLEDIIIGDTIFIDYSEGYTHGHPTTVLRADRNNFRELNENAISIFDPNVSGRMICGVYNVDTINTLKMVLSADSLRLGVLRTEFADNDFFLHKKNTNTMLLDRDVPPEINSSRQEVIPDLHLIKKITNGWERYKGKQFPDAINTIVNLVGLHVRDMNGNIVQGLRWQNQFGNNEWICNIYSTFLIKALGINEISHWFVNGEPSQNVGEEYSVRQMHEWMNRRGRDFGWIDVSYKTKEERTKLLENKYVLFGASKGHSWVILPALNHEGRIIPAMSQAGYDFPLRAPNSQYKFDEPSACQDFIPQNPNIYSLEEGESILWAHALPGVKEIMWNNERLYERPISLSRRWNLANTESGILTSIELLKEQVGDISNSNFGDFVRTFLDPEAEKLVENNSIFRYTFDVVKTIQKYQLPLRPQGNDSAMFVKYLRNELTMLGYKSMLEGQYADAVFRNISTSFVTYERSLTDNRPFQPMQCVVFAQLLDLANKKIIEAPAKIGGLSVGNAQDIANYLLNLQYAYNTGESTVDKNTVAVHLPENRPIDLNHFKRGDAFFIAYPNDRSEGHVGIVVSNPFINKEGETVIAVADSNRISIGNNIIADGMPRIRILNYSLFIKNFMQNEEGMVIGKMIILRSSR